jgi:hypothetical protein
MKNSEGFYWERHPEVERFFFHYLDIYRRKNSFIKDFERDLIRQTSSGILGWIDHIMVKDSAEIRMELNSLGFKRNENTDARAFYHPGVLLPAVLLVDNSSESDPGIAFCVEDIDIFLRANGLEKNIEGPALGPYRHSCIHCQNGTSFCVVERRGTRNFDPVFPEDDYFRNYVQGIADWKNLRRDEEDEEKIFAEMKLIAGNLVTNLGAGPAAHIVLLCERDYWVSRNSAGKTQKKRQDALGIGWANQDHHTFRSSRRNFSKLIDLFLQLGFHKRERFYAGEEAGWGAQVMEHPIAGLCLFLDVDLAPEEVDIDFSEHDLQDRETLGTVGLWCALHGDSILKAGMHHLAARFDFERLIEDAAGYKISFMPPFSNFPYLKQAFSVAEIWPVAPSGIRKLVQEKLLSEAQAGKFLDRGSVGSHMENIERRDGYKGFNKKNVSAIIQETDPRKD